jgi:hypothetical protein
VGQGNPPAADDAGLVQARVHRQAEWDATDCGGQRPAVGGVVDGVGVSNDQGLDLATSQGGEEAAERFAMRLRVRIDRSEGVDRRAQPAVDPGAQGMHLRARIAPGQHEGAALGAPQVCERGLGEPSLRPMQPSGKAGRAEAGGQIDRQITQQSRSCCQAMIGGRAGKAIARLGDVDPRHRWALTAAHDRPAVGHLARPRPQRVGA